MLSLPIRQTLSVGACRQTRNYILINVRRRSEPHPRTPPFTKTFSDWTRAEADEKGKKRLFICCDGTWKSASGTITPPTNVARLARSVDRHGWDKKPAVPQITYYTGGVGTQSVLPIPVDYWYSGATGEGLEMTILNAYCFLCNNYNFCADNDEIMLVGFSRGAFAVRCLALLISEIGLIRRRHLSLLPNVFESWWRGKGKIDPKYRDAEISRAVRIKVLAEWDTVSALWSRKFDFVKGEVPSVVDNAFMAIALDEERWSFKPIPWTKRGQPVKNWERKPEDNHKQRVEQRLFTGSHSDIGGGDNDAGLSTISLLWMVSQIQSVSDAAFDRGALLQVILPLSSMPWLSWILGKDPSDTIKYKSILLSGGYLNSPPWWWAVPRYLTLNAMSGKRHHLFDEEAQRGNELKDTLKVHFSVPLLGEGIAKGDVKFDSKSKEVQLWKDVKLSWQDPEGKEVNLWKTWRDMAKDWHPDPNSKDDDMQDWGNIMKKINMQDVRRTDERQIIAHLFQEMSKKSNHLHSLFSDLPRN